MKDERYRVALEAYRIIRPEHLAIHEAILNWARWCRVSSVVHRRTPSLEGRYRPPPMYDYPIPSMPPDINHAHKLEALIVEAPHDYGKHIRLWYIRRLPLEAAGKKLHIAYFQLEAHLAASREYVLNHLTLA